MVSIDSTASAFHSVSHCRIDSLSLAVCTATPFELSAGLATILNPKLGYDRVAELVKESKKTGKNLRQLVLETAPDEKDMANLNDALLSRR